MKVAIIGLGYVGLPLACLCAEKGLEVYGAELDTNKASLIEKGISPIEDAYLKEAVKKFKGKLKIFGKTEDAVKNSEVIIVCVPTPVDENHIPDLTALKGASISISKGLKDGALVIIESTIFHGTVEDIVLPIIKESKKAFFLLTVLKELTQEIKNSQ